MKAGQLNRRVTLQKRTSVQNGFGEPQLAWVEASAVFAAIEPLSGRKLESALRVASDVTHSITIRYQARYADTREMANYRAVYGTRIFNIHGGYSPNEARVAIVLVAQEGLSEV